MAHGSWPLRSFRLSGPRRCPRRWSSRFPTAVFGLYPLDTVRKQSTEEILRATAWQGGVLDTLPGAEQELEVPCRRQSDCNARMNRVHVLIPNARGNCRRKRL